MTPRINFPSYLLTCTQDSVQTGQPQRVQLAVAGVLDLKHPRHLKALSLSSSVSSSKSTAEATNGLSVNITDPAGIRSDATRNLPNSAEDSIWKNFWKMHKTC